jgi:hypothetical protein
VTIVEHLWSTQEIVPSRWLRLRPPARLEFSPAGCRGLSDDVRAAEVAGRAISGPAEGDSADVARLAGQWREADIRHNGQVGYLAAPALLFLETSTLTGTP